MVFSYVVMQALPPTLPSFHHVSGTVSTLADILYGRKKYTSFNCTCTLYIILRDQMIMLEYMHTFHFEHRPAKVSFIPGTSVLGGVTLKVLSPDVHSALLDIFATEGLDVPSGSLTTFYRLEKKWHNFL